MINFINRFDEERIPKYESGQLVVICHVAERQADGSIKIEVWRGSWISYRSERGLFDHGEAVILPGRTNEGPYDYHQGTILEVCESPMGDIMYDVLISRDAQTQYFIEEHLFEFEELEGMVEIL